MTRLYLITPPTLDLDAFAPQFESALNEADIACVQLRLKDASDEDWKKAVKRLMPLAHARDIAFILNDRADLAKQLGADGVHLGEEDTSYEKARAALGPDAIIGVSCYDSKDKAMVAAEAGADYVAFGAAYPSTTKTTGRFAPLSLYQDWAMMATTPCVAIGGITALNCPPLVQAGVDFLAVISAVWDFPGGAAAGAKALQSAIDKA